MKRIVRHTHESGKESFEVQTNRWFFGLLPCRWYTMCIPVIESGYEFCVGAEFSSLREACIMCECSLKNTPIIDESEL